MTRRTPRIAGTLAVLAMSAPIVTVVSGSGATAPVAGPKKHLRVKVGPVPTLFPGVTTTFPVRVRNPYPNRIRVVRLRVTALPAPQCGAENLVLGSYPVQVRIKAKRSRRVFLPIGLRADAPMSCERVTWKLKVRVRAGR